MTPQSENVRLERQKTIGKSKSLKEAPFMFELSPELSFTVENLRILLCQHKTFSSGLDLIHPQAALYGVYGDIKSVCIQRF